MPPKSRRPAGTLVRAGAPAQERELRAQGRKTVAKLLEAGRVVFEQRGFHGARVDDVVKVARTSHGTFYLYFANKEDLFTALAKAAVEELHEVAEELPNVTPDEDGVIALRNWIQRFFEVYERHGPVIRAWTEGEVQNTGLGREGEVLFARLSADIAARIDEVGTAPHVDHRIAALALLALVERFAYLVYSRDIVSDQETMLDTLASVAHAGFFSGQSMPNARRFRRAKRA